MAIEFDFTGNNTDFIKAVEEIQSSVMHMSAVLGEVGNSFDISNVREQILSVSQVIQATEENIAQSRRNIEQWMKESMEAQEIGDFETVDERQSWISDELETIRDNMQGIEEMKGALRELMELRSNLSGDKAPMLFNSQEEYDNVRRLKDAIADLHTQILMAEEDADTSDLQSELSQLEDELRNCEVAAADNAKKLGANGAVAAEASAKYYEMTHAIRDQEAKVINLTMALRQEERNLKAAMKEGEPTAIIAAQEEVERLKKSLAGAKMELSGLQAQQIEYGKRLNSYGNEIDNLTQKTNDFSSVLRNVAAIAGITFSLNQIKGFAQKVMDVRSYFQDIESSMKVFLGSEEKSAEFTKNLKDYAYYNMFEFSDLAKASQQMIAYGHDVDSIIPRLDQLSNVAQGTHAPLLELVNAYNKAKSTGFVDGRDVQSWAVKGVMIKDTLKEMGEEAAGTSVTFDQLNKVLDKVTGEGGMFHNLMGEMMENISAEKGQLADNMDSMFNEIGEKYEEIIAKGYKLAGNVVNDYEQILGGVINAGVGIADNTIDWLAEHYLQLANVIKDVVVAIGAWKAALIAVNGVTKVWNALAAASAIAHRANAIAAAGEAAAKGHVTVATVLLNNAQKALNKTMLANPYALAAAALAGLVFTIYKLATAESAAEKGTRQANAELEKQTDLLNERKDNIGSLINTIKDGNESEYARLDAYKKLTAIAPEIAKAYTQEELAALSLDEVTKMLNEDRVNAEYEQAKKNVEEYTEKLKKAKEAVENATNVGGGYGISNLTKEVENAEAALRVYKDKLSKIEQIREEAAEKAKPITIKVEEANSNYQTRRDILDFYSDMMEEMEDAEGHGVSFEQSARNVDDFIEKTKDELADLTKQVEDNPTDYKLELAKKEKEKVLEELLGLKSDIVKQGLNSLPFIIRFRYDDAAKAEEEARKKEREGMHFVNALMGNETNANGESGYWVANEPEKVHTSAEWNKILRKNLKAAQKELDDFNKGTGEYKGRQFTENERKEERKRLEGKVKVAKDALGSDAPSKNEDKENAKRKATTIREEWQYQDDLAKAKREGARAATAAEIEQEEIGWKREQRQREEQHRQRLEELKEQEKAIYKAVYEQRKKEWERIHKDSPYELTEEGRKGYKQEDIEGTLTDKEKEYVETRKVIVTSNIEEEEAKWNRYLADTKKAEEDAMNAYLKEYGKYEERRLAIAKEYDDKIAKVQTQGEREKLLKDKDKELNALDLAYEKSTSKISALYADMSEKTVAELRKIHEEGEAALAFLNDGVWDEEKALSFGITKETFERIKNSPNELKAIRDLLDKIEDSANSADTAFGRIGNAFKKLSEAKKGTTEVMEAISDMSDGINSAVSAVSFLQSCLSSLSDSFESDALESMVEGLEVATSAVSSTLSGVQAGAAFGPIGAAIGGAIGLVTSLASSIAKIHDKNKQKEIDDYAKKIKALGDAYDELGEEIDEVYSTDKAKKIQESNKLLEQQIIYVQRQMAAEQAKNKTDKDAVEGYKDKLKDLRKQIEENEEAAFDAIFGSDIRSAIEGFASAMTSAWENEEDAARNAKEVVKNMMKSMVDESVKAAIQSSDAMTRIRDKMAKFYADGVFTASEREELEREAEDLQRRIDDKFAWAKDLYGEDEEYSQQASSRGFQAMSQDVGEELNGRFTALQIAGESMNINTTLILENMNAMMELSRMNGVTFSELRNLAITRNSYLEDIAKYSKRMFLDFTDRLDELVDNTKYM